MSLTGYEREVHISYNDDSDTATIYAASRPTITKCKKAGYELIAENNIGGTVTAIFKCSKDLISFRSGKTTRKPLTEEQKQERAERMRGINKTNE